MTMQLPPIPAAGLVETKSALHAAAKVLGDQLKRTRPRRKHWWHASLRLSLHGLTTGVIAGEVDVELEIDFAESELLFRSSSGETREVSLRGQSAREISDSVHAFYDSVGFVSDKSQRGDHERDETIQPDYSTEVAGAMGETFRAVGNQFAALRASFREEASPIQVWPHHFDLSMLWLPGTLIDGQDPADEESADQQLNFGFTFGDGTISEPYFYITAYPTSDAYASIDLPDGARWQTDGFSGVVMPLAALEGRQDPAAHLQDLWGRCLAFGREHLGAKR